MIAARPVAAAMVIPIWPSALVALGRSRDAVRQALEQRWASLRESRRAVTRVSEEARLDAFDGDFASALRRLDDAARAFQSDASAESQALLATVRVELELEIGRPSDAGRDAATYLQKRKRGRPFANRWAIRRPASSTSRTARAARRRRVPRGTRRVVRRLERGWQRDGLGDRLRLRRDAGRGCGGLVLPARRRAPEELPPKHPEKQRGSVGSCSSRSARRRPSLCSRSRAKSCHALVIPFEHTRASDALGQALEATGDKPGACAAYKVVLDRWGKAKPRSVTADHARARSTALGCGG